MIPKPWTKTGWFRISCAVAAGLGLAAVLLGLATRPASQGMAPQAMKGRLDAGAWNLSQAEPLPLSGEWEFVPNALLDEAEFQVARLAGKVSYRHVPDFWEGGDAGGRDGQGSGTYRIHVHLPRILSEPALRWTTISTAFGVLVNDQKVGGVGTPALDRAFAVPAYRPEVVPIGNPGQDFVIMVQVSNFEYRSGGMWQALVLGRLPDLQAAKRGDDWQAIALTAAIGATAINSFFFFLFRRQEKTHLYFAIFALVVSFRSLVTGEYLIIQIWPGLSFDLLIRLEYLTAQVPVIAGVWFFLSLFPAAANRLGKILLTVPALPFLVFDLLFPLPNLTRTIAFFYLVAFPIIIGGLILIGRQMRTNASFSAQIILAAAVMVGAAGTNDALVASFLVSNALILPWAVAIFVLMQAAVLARNFTVTHKKLETTIQEKEVLLLEVHHRVRNSLQIISSFLSLKSRRTDDQALHTAYESIRDRIKAISLAHEKLYRLGSIDRINLGSYVTDLTHLLADSFEASSVKPVVEAHMAEIGVRVEFVVDVGLVLTELIANAYKHAVLVSGGTVRVMVARSEDTIRLTVADNGPGFPANSLNKSGSLGLKVVSAVVSKYQGTLDIRDEAGATVTVYLPLPAESLQD